MSSAIMLLTIAVIAMEGVAWMFAERFGDTIATIDERSVNEHHRAYTSVDRWGVLDLGLRRVHSRLRPALLLVGERVIADFRREEPAMGRAEWGQAHEALTWLVELSSDNRVLLGQQLTAEAHVKRLAAQSTKGSASTLLSQAALAKFRQAATVDPDSFDPYLGMARIQVYSLADVDGAAASIAEAEKRGYTSGRREAALLGDGYLRRARRLAAAAAVLTGEQRVRELNNARADYQRCVVFFDPIVAFANAAENLELCKVQMQRIDRLLSVPGGGQ